MVQKWKILYERGEGGLWSASLRKIGDIELQGIAFGYSLAEVKEKILRNAPIEFYATQCEQFTDYGLPFLSLSQMKEHEPS